MAQNYVAQTIDDETQDKLFEEALAELEDAQWHHSRIVTLMHS